LSISKKLFFKSYSDELADSDDSFSKDSGGLIRGMGVNIDWDSS